MKYLLAAVAGALLAAALILGTLTLARPSVAAVAPTATPATVTGSWQGIALYPHQAEATQERGISFTTSAASTEVVPWMHRAFEAAGLTRQQDGLQDGVPTYTYADRQWIYRWTARGEGAGTVVLIARAAR